jgi:hypothetical protein
VPDETGWKVGGLLHWPWVFATTMTTVYRICPGRRHHDATARARPDRIAALLSSQCFSQLTRQPDTKRFRCWRETKESVRVHLGAIVQPCIHSLIEFVLSREQEKGNGEANKFGNVTDCLVVGRM